MPEISQEQLDKLLERVATLEGITSETRRKEWQEKQKNDPNIKTVYLKKFNGKLVYAWSDMTINKNKKLANGDYEEELRTKLLFHDGTIEEVDYMDFVRSNDLEHFKIVLVKNAPHPLKEKVQVPTFTLERADETTFEVPVYAVNP